MQRDSKQDPTRKYPCPDCKMCQGCSEVRCLACRGKRDKHGRKKLSVQEQIALFNSLNPHLGGTMTDQACSHPQCDPEPRNLSGACLSEPSGHRQCRSCACDGMKEHHGEATRTKLDLP